MPTTTDAPTARKTEILNWNPHEKGTLKGYFSAVLESGMIIHKLALFEKGNSRWINMPCESREVNGQKIYKPLIEFSDDETLTRFTKKILAAFDARPQETK